MDRVVVGKVRTSHGVKGDLKIFSISEEYDHFRDFKTVVLKKGKREKEFVVEAVKGQGTGTLMKLEGIDSPEEGKLYAGYDIVVDREFMAPCGDDEFYQADLIGCSLVFNGETVGKVLSILNGGPNDLLEVEKSSDGKVVLVPFRNEFVGEVDIPSKSIKLVVDWILD